MTPKQKTWATIVIGAVVAIAPSTFGYLQARQEIGEKYRLSNKEADAGYKTLVESVQQLQLIVRAQHDQITKLQGTVEALVTLRLTPVRIRSTPPDGENPAPSEARVRVLDALRLRTTSNVTAEPKFTVMPANLDAAQHAVANKD